MIAWAVVMLVITGAAGYAVGELAQPGSTWFANITERGQFAWQPATVAAAATAGVLLAASTAALAWSTSRTVAAAAGLADALRADGPVVVVLRLDVAGAEAASGGAGKRVTVAWAVRNVGSGPAIGLDVRVEYAGDLGLERSPCSHAAATLSPSDPELSGTCTFTVPAGAAGEVDADDFRVAGDYLDRGLRGRMQVIDPRRV